MDRTVLQINRHNGFEPIPPTIINMLSLHGVDMQRSTQRYTVFDKTVLFPYLIIGSVQTFYPVYIPNSAARRSWELHPLGNPRAIEYAAKQCGIQPLLIFEKDIDMYGLDTVVYCISEKVNPVLRDKNKVSVSLNPHDQCIDIFFDSDVVGRANFTLSATAISISQWYSILPPDLWLEKAAQALTLDNNKRVLKFSFHPHGITDTEGMMFFSRKMEHKKSNVIIKGQGHIVRSDGWIAYITLPYHEGKEMFSEKTPVRTPPPLRYPYHEAHQKVVDDNKKVKNNVVLKRKLSPDNPPEVSELSASSHQYALFLCVKGHHYYAELRSQLRYGCPVCSGHTVIPGVNDLATTDPNVAVLWDYDGSFPYQPTDVSRKSDKVVSWLCPVSNTSWQAPVSNTVENKVSPYVAHRKLLPGFNDIATRFPELVPLWDKSNPISLDSVLSISHPGSFLWKCPTCHGQWERMISSMVKRPYCAVCSKTYTTTSSRGEKELLGYIQKILGEDTIIIANNRSTIAPYELDIYIPDHSIAIEYNGLYWHTESAGKDRNYHYNKWRECRDRGIQLITIWEDEWRDKRELVKKMLAHKLGVSGDTRTFARKTTVVQLESSVAREFCDTHHIQGAANGSTYLGLEDKAGELVAVSVWRKNKDVLYLERYCTSTTVVGGMGKLLKAGKSWARDNSCYKIVTFADHQVSDGNLYETLGFTKDKELSPDYKYVIDGQRKHKFGYRLKRFQSDPQLLYREGYTETQLAQLNGLERVWDCGKTRYVMEV